MFWSHRLQCLTDPYNSDAQHNEIPLFIPGGSQLSLHYQEFPSFFRDDLTGDKGRMPFDSGCRKEALMHWTRKLAQRWRSRHPWL